MTFPKLYDEGAFSVDRHAYLDAFQSYDKDGHPLIFSATEWECEGNTRLYLKWKQEGCLEARTVNSGVVSGKL
jgi:hypothetical protein